MQSLKTKSVARFTKDSLSIFTAAQLKKIRAVAVGVEFEDEKVRAWAKKTIGTSGPNVTEMTLINEALSDLDQGITGTAGPYEERTLPKKGLVTYDPKTITLTTRNGQDFLLPNLPVPPSQQVSRLGEDRLVAIIWALFDFDQGQLVTIRDATLETAYYGHPDTVYNPQGVLILKKIIGDMLLSSRYAHVFSDKKTISGHAAADFWYRFVGSLNDDDYLALHSQMITNLYRHVEVKADKNNIIRPVSKIVRKDGTPQPAKVPASTFLRVHLNAKAFEKEGYMQVIISKPVAPVAVMLRTINTPRELLSIYKDSVTMRGGNSRGVGLFATYWDYCPRQSEITRRLNWFIMAVSNSNMKCQVHLKAGDLTLMNVWRAQLSQTSSKAASIEFYVPESEMKGQARLEHYVSEVDHSKCQVIYADFKTPPDVTAALKQRAANDAAIEQSVQDLNRFLGTYPRMMIHAPFYSPANEKEGRYVFRHGHGHDLRATYSTVADILADPAGNKWLTPTNFVQYAEAARLAIKQLNGWPLSAVSCYSSLGTWFQGIPSNVEFDGTSWTFVDSVPIIPPPKTKTTTIEEDEDEEIPDRQTEALTTKDAPYVGATTLGNNSSNTSNVRIDQPKSVAPGVQAKGAPNNSPVQREEEDDEGGDIPDQEPEIDDNSDQS